MRMTVIWPDWNRLVQEGNAKAIGTPWTDEEWKILEAIQDEEERKQVVEELREGNYKPKKTEKSEKTETKTETPKKDSSKEPKKTEKSEKTETKTETPKKDSSKEPKKTEKSE